MIRIWLFQSREFSTVMMPDSTPGKDCAEYLVTVFSQLGCAVENVGVSGDEFGWYFDFKKGTLQFEVNVHIAFEKGKEEPLWSARVRPLLGILQSLFAWYKKQGREATVETVYALIDQALKAQEHNGRLQKVNWLTEDEFDSRYEC